LADDGGGDEVRMKRERVKVKRREGGRRRRIDG
jgi:hypothetical protein